MTNRSVIITTMDDKTRTRYMQQAMRLALKGAGFVAPNPRVGAVIVKSNQVIGRGFHRRFAGPHAEIEAINDCVRNGKDPAGATLFVNLEPCCHHGKTGPCTDAIIRAGIAQVDMATLDDFESVKGRGAAILREHGIEVRIGCCQKQARRLNAGFFKWIRTGRPSTVLKWAQSIDGCLAYPTTTRWISNEKSRRHVHQFRSRCGAILVGIGTVLTDDPLLTVRPAGKRHQPLRVVLDSQLRIPEDCRLVRTAGESSVLIYTRSQSIENNRVVVSKLQAARCEVVGVAGQDGRVSLEAVLDDLGGRGITNVLVEGGATILKSFIDQQLIDRFMIYIAPVCIGNREDVPHVDFALPSDSLHDITITTLDTDVLIEAFTEAAAL